MMMGRQRMQEHIGQHLAALQQENPAMAKQFMGAMQVMDPMSQQAPTPEAPGMEAPAGPMPAMAQPEPDLAEALA